MSSLEYLFAVGVLAGAMNALAGGGSFVTLPALIAAGLPSVAANASSTVALWPGGAASAWTYHDGFRPVCGVPIVPMLVVTLAGGLLGSVLLLFTPTAAFDFILPWLLLLATVALAFGRRVGAALKGRLRGRVGPGLLVQTALGVYGGYFGGAVGLMMVAVWSVLGESDVKALNGPRTLLVSAANTVAVVAFIIAGAVRWPQTLAMLAGGVLGGTLGARLGRVVPARVTRKLTLGATTAITCAFFLRAYGHLL
jgi:uncharacterized membrane protein YfcA